MEVTGETPPLWPQLTTATPRRRPPSPIFSLPALIILLPILPLLLLFLAVPPFLSVTAEILGHLSVRKSWDSLNVFLVLFAIIFSVLARRNDGDETSNSNGNDVKNDSVSDSSKASGHHHASKQWFEHPERKIYDGSAPINVRPSPETNVRRLKRSGSSYPDMRQDSLWVNNEDRLRFFDDFEINNHRSSTSYGDQESEARVIPVDTFVLRSSPSPSPPSKHPPLSTPLPPLAALHKPRRTYQAVGQKYHKVMNQNCRAEINEIKSPSATPPQPPPPPPRRPPSPLIQVGNRSEQKHGNSERRRTTATKEIKMVFASLRKRKKKHKTQDGHQQDCPLHSPTEPPPNNSTSIRPTSPAPPPPPPPSSVFQKYNLFRKSSKSKTIHSVPTPPPPPPPTPSATFYSARLSKHKNQIAPPSKSPPEPSRKRTTPNNDRPPLPTKANTTSYYDDNVNSGEQSPLIPMPTPPPPFKMPDFKLVIRGDFVKTRSSPSSQCSSPDMEETDVSSSKDESETGSMMEGDDGAEVASAPVYCPSPDVNAKAETFIARFRDEWKLEKINSMKEKQII